MTFYNGKPAAKINEIMKSYIPETAGCHYADFPMNRAKWLKGNEKTDKGEPCFIKTDSKMACEGMKHGYVWGPGPFTFGYYHLLTKTAYVIIYTRILNNKVATGEDEGCCGCFGSSDPASKMPAISADDKDDMRLLFHARSVATKPSDAQAQVDQMGESKATAQAHYQYDQNVQGAIYAGGVTAAIMQR